MSGTNENPPRSIGRKPNLTALNVTKACAAIFEAGTDLKAKMTRNPYTENTSEKGAFHSFVSEIFKFLEIEANPEHFIKKLSSEEITK